MNPFVALAIFIPAVSALTVNTPMAPVTCQPLQITWSPEGSKEPYFISLIPAGQPSASALKQFPPQQGTSYSWEKVSLPANTQFTVAMKDGSGQQVYSAPATVQEGSDSNCVNHDVKEGEESTSGSATYSTSGAPDSTGTTTSSGTSASHAAAAAATGSGSPTLSNSAPASHKSDGAKSTSSASPSQSVKANSVARDISSGAIAGIMVAVGLTSVLVTLVV